MTMTNPPPILSWGYQGQRVETLAFLLASYRATLVDVRYKPWSRLAGWSQRALRARFGDRYVWVPELGNLRWRSADDVELADPQAGAQRVAAVLEQQAVVLVCMCPDAARCHRHEAAQVVAALTGSQIIHVATAPTRRRGGRRRLERFMQPVEAVSLIRESEDVS